MRTLGIPKQQSYMTSQIATRKAALTLAWNMVKNSALSFADAQRKAWATVKLQASMSTRPTSFFYIKRDGSERFAVGSLELPGRGTAATTAPGLVIRYYDMLARGYRSFRADRLLLD